MKKLVVALISAQRALPILLLILNILCLNGFANQGTGSANSSEETNHCGTKLDSRIQYATHHKAVENTLNHLADSMGWSQKAHRELRDLAKSPDMRQFFNSELAQPLYKVEPNQLTVEMIATRIITEYVQQQTKHQIEYDSLTKSQKFTLFLKKNTSSFVRGAAALFLVSTLVGPFQNILSGLTAPVTDPIVAHGRALAFRYFPDSFRPDGYVNHHQENGTNENEFFTGIWREASARLPMIQREGRGYYYEAETLFLICEQVHLQLHEAGQTQAASTEEIKSSYQHLYDVLNSLDEMFPDVVHTEYGRTHLFPQVDTLKNHIARDIEAL